MRTLTTSLAIVVASLAACVGPRDSNRGEHIELLRKSPGRQLLSIARQEWRGLWGPDGYEGYRTVGYWAALEGEGPTFVNPRFQDSPLEYRCVGTITLDLERRTVKIEMRRVVSKAGEPERTKPHPANGTFRIETIRDARKEEGWF